jgi:hypothetical protein
MPCINIPIEAVGPTLDVGISPPTSLVAAGTPAPKITWFKAIADTGCSHTSIHTSVATACGLTVAGKTGVTTPAGNVAVNLYLGDLYLRSMISWTTPFEWNFASRGLLEMVHKNPAFDILLGMDILNQGTFFTNGGLRQATFCW